jgi:L-ascorbate metabolism protein UlaG (beta-lactamase superfamily)
MKLTWLGHSAFRIEAGNSVILVDPFFTGNPKFPGTVAEASEGVTHIVITHGHDDHTGDAADIAARTGAQLISNFEVCTYLAHKGAENINPGNTGGTIDAGEFTVTLTPALHSASTEIDGLPVYLGNPNGVIINHKNGPTIYHSGDTDLFSDMKLINELYRPAIGLIPVGDRFTMSGRTAAIAVQRYFDFDTVIPMHWGTFPIIDQTPDAFVEAMQGANTKVVIATPGVALEF